MTKLIYNVEFYTTTDLEKLLGYSQAAVWGWRKRGNSPFPFKFYKIGGRILYKKQEVDEYLERTLNVSKENANNDNS